MSQRSSQRSSQRDSDKHGTLTDSLLSEAPQGQTVAQYSTRRGRKSRSRRTRKGEKLASIDAAWYVFDGLTEGQAETLLKNHGSNGSYLLSQYDESKSYRMSFIAHNTIDGDQVCRHFDIIHTTSRRYTVKELPDIGDYATVEEAVQQVSNFIKSEDLLLMPIFHESEETGNYSISPEAADVPPRYMEARRYPTAPQKRLPIVLRPTLRKFNILASSSVYRSRDEEAAVPPAEESPSGCCYRVWHTDPDGSWYKPHKAGCLTAIFIILGWLFFILLFGWIIAIALVLVTILIAFAATINFLCTGHCQLGDDDDYDS